MRQGEEKMILLIAGVLVMLIGFLSGTLIAAAVGLAALVANAPLGVENTLAMCNILAWNQARSFTLTAVPLFTLMGEIFGRSGLVDDMFNAFHVLTRGRTPGGLLQPTMLTATIFSAFSGSSTASTAAMGQVIYPVLRRHNYDDGLSTGALAAGGSLDMMIPPSIILVLCAGIMDVSLGKLYMAAFTPGLMSAAMFMVYLGFRVPNPQKLMAKGSEGDSKIGQSRAEQMRAILTILPFFALILLVMGPLYLGIATATEVAAVGTAACIALSCLYKKFNLKLLWDSAIDAVRVTSMIYFIMFGMLSLSSALASSGVTIQLPILLKSLGSQHVVFALITSFYFILGMLFDPISILLLTAPVMFPVLKAFGFSDIWCGIYIPLQIEIGLLTPPVGINLFVMHGATGVPFSTVSKGCAPFVALLLFMTLLIYLFPQLVGWLPNLMR
jgi:C4-dicarboxylate transporter DctM subunit